MSAPDPADDLTADAIRARTIDGACDRCGQMPDQTCYLPARRCPRPAPKATPEALPTDEEQRGDVD